jgi:tetratricopeptide (TPR) repeat protein
MMILMTELILASFLLSTTPDLDSGKKLRQEGKLEEAIVVFEDVLANQPDSLEAQRELGHSLVLAGRYSEAIRVYEKLAGSDDLRWQLESAKWSGLAHLYRGDIEAASAKSKEEAELAKQLGERSAQVHATWYAGHVHTELGQFGRANVAFIAALDIGPNDLNALHLVGVLAARQGDWGSLRYQIQDLEEAIARSGDPDQLRRVYHLFVSASALSRSHRPRLPRRGKPLPSGGHLSSYRGVHRPAARHSPLLRQGLARAGGGIGCPGAE